MWAILVFKSIVVGHTKYIPKYGAKAMRRFTSTIADWLSCPLLFCPVLCYPVLSLSMYMFPYIKPAEIQTDRQTVHADETSCPQNIVKCASVFRQILSRVVYGQEHNGPPTRRVVSISDERWWPRAAILLPLVFVSLFPVCPHLNEPVTGTFRSTVHLSADARPRTTKYIQYSLFCGWLSCDIKPVEETLSRSSYLRCKNKHPSGQWCTDTHTHITDIHSPQVYFLFRSVSWRERWVVLAGAGNDWQRTDPFHFRLSFLFPSQYEGCRCGKQTNTAERKYFQCSLHGTQTVHTQRFVARRSRQRSVEGTP